MARADHVERPDLSVEHDVVDARLEVLGCELTGPFRHQVRCPPRCDTADLGGLRAVGAYALTHLVGVALDDTYRLER